MKQQEKTRLTRIRIMNAAIQEYGNKGYHGGSINAICSDNHISKGLIYHNYKSKDDLYLEAIRYSIDKQRSFINEHAPTGGDIRQQIQARLQLRRQFFRENPSYYKLFLNSRLDPPAHLRQQIQQLRTEPRDAYRGPLAQMLQNVQLRPGISLDLAVDYFLICGEMFNTYFQNLPAEELEDPAAMEKADSYITTMTDIVLYGIAVKPE